MNTLNFLDANVWLALVWGRHIHSERARDWLEKSPEEKCFRQLDLAPFDLFFWPHPLVIHHSAPGRSEALRRP
jgi:hypothetical protein